MRRFLAGAGFGGHRPAHGLVEPYTARLAHDCDLTS